MENTVIIYTTISFLIVYAVAFIVFRKNKEYFIKKKQNLMFLFFGIFFSLWAILGKAYITLMYQYAETEKLQLLSKYGIFFSGWCAVIFTFFTYKLFKEFIQSKR
jgi:hypothetical protein